MVAQVTDRDRNGGRGGRGRSLPPAGGRGAGGAARGDKGAGRGGTSGAPAGGAPPAGGRGTSVSRSTNERPTNGEQTPSPPLPSQGSRQSDHHRDHRESEPSKGKSSSAPPPPAKNVVTGPSANTPWGTGGMNLAEKLKLAELQKTLPPPAPVVVPTDQNEPPRENNDAGDDKGNRSRRSRGRGAGPSGATGEKKKDDVITSDGSDGLVEAMVDMTIKKEESVTPAMSFPVPQPAPVGMNHASANVASPDRSSSVAQQQQQQQQQQASPNKNHFLPKMGKFEPPIGSEVNQPFKFGSFGQGFGGSADELQQTTVPSSSSSSSSAWASVIGSSTGSSSAGPEKASEEQKNNQPSNTDVQTSVASLSSAGVWGNNGASTAPGGSTGGASADTMSSLFPNSAKGLLSDATNVAVNSSSSQQTSRYEQKPSAPPG